MGASALIGLATLIWTRALRHILLWMRARLRSGASNDLLLAELTSIRNELKPDSGNSIRDVLNYLVRQGATTNARVLSWMENVGDPMWQANQAGERTWANKAYLTLTGRPLAEVTGWGWVNTIHPEERERIRAQWVQAVTEKRNFEETYRIVDTRGGVHPVSVIAQVFESGTGGKDPVGTDEHIWIAYVRPLR